MGFHVSITKWKQCVKKGYPKIVTPHQFLSRKYIHEVIGSSPGRSVDWSLEWCKLSLYANESRDEEAIYFER